MKTVKWAIIIVISVFFLLAGGLKVYDPVEFARAILRYRIVNQELSWIAALWLPWLEIIAACALFLRDWRKSACWVILMMMVLFEIALASAYFRGLDIDCGCLGTNASSSVSFALLRNVFIIAGVSILMRIDHSKGEENRNTDYRG